jgi:acetylornithine deacetylase/succinyl-diaminopimelate desuccinylase-like protein
MAKVSCRLVPDQLPAKIEALMKAHVAKVAPKGVTVTVTHLHGGKPWRADLEGPLFEAAKKALAAAFGREPVVTGEGGSIPVVGDFERILGVPVLLMGFGLPGENAHVRVAHFRRGFGSLSGPAAFPRQVAGGGWSAPPAAAVAGRRGCARHRADEGRQSDDVGSS